MPYGLSVKLRKANDFEVIIPTLYQAMYESIAAHSRLGLNVVVDVGHHDNYATPRGILEQGPPPSAFRQLAAMATAHE